MRLHTNLYDSIAKQKVDSEKETQETPAIQLNKSGSKKQSIPNVAAVRRTYRDAGTQSMLDFENV
jgi:hypothetical protein